MDFSGVEELRVTVPSADGVDVPLTILRKRGLPLDGTHPTRLIGYGAYGISLEPAFDPRTLAWLERGGVVAYAHVRGGGERGVEWHRAGQKATKMRSVADFIACGEYLIAQGYTTPRLLFAEGGSAGGMLVGRAMTERPELFGAVLFDVGLANPLRFELTQGGPANVAEFGTATTPEGFLALLMADTYHHVQTGVGYPAILVTAGTDDVRLPFWQSAKLAARLQAVNLAGRPVLLRAEKGDGHRAGHQTPAVADKWSFFLWQAGDPEFQPARTGTGGPAAR
jgi:prolyl oligopeptidase